MNYYKITNESESHYGLQCKTGLNVDILPFSPSGDCEPGGIHFAREDILAFLYCGGWLRQVTMPPNAQVYENPGRPKKWKADKVILGRRRKVTTRVIRELLKEGADPKAGNSSALCWAAWNGHTDIVRLLLDAGADPKAGNSYALTEAAWSGHTDCVKLLLPVSDPKANNSSALHCSAGRGHTDCVQLLLPVSDPKDFRSALDWAAGDGRTNCVKLLLAAGADPKAGNSSALREAAWSGHTEIVRLLIPLCDPKAGNSCALHNAAHNGHTDCVKLLLPVSDPKDFRSALKWASARGQTEIVELLKKEMLKIVIDNGG